MDCPVPAPPATEASLVWSGAGPVPQALRGAVLAVGNFDGVHLGHRALIEKAAREAVRCGGGGVVALTFEPHPRTYFRPDQPVFRLTPPVLKREALRRAGCVGIVELPFDGTMAAMSADAFIDELLLGALDAQALVVGPDFRFGKQRSGDVSLLQSRFLARGRAVTVQRAVLDSEGEVVSSSAIRAALSLGNVERARALMGEPWQVRAEIRHGDKRGRELGYPTANMLLPPETALRHGIYAVRIRLADVWRDGVASFGRRPTFDDGAPRLETHVFDFAGDLYGQLADVAFIAWIRDEARFDGVASLIRQMDADSAIARRRLSDNPQRSP